MGVERWGLSVERRFGHGARGGRSRCFSAAGTAEKCGARTRASSSWREPSTPGRRCSLRRDPDTAWPYRRGLFTACAPAFRTRQPRCRAHAVMSVHDNLHPWPATAKGRQTSESESTDTSGWVRLTATVRYRAAEHGSTRKRSPSAGRGRITTRIR